MPALFVTPEPAALPTGVPVAQAEIGTVVDLVRRHDGDVVLVSFDPVSARAARAARLVLDDSRVGLVDLAPPPTLAFVLAAAAQLVPDYALGYLPSVLDGTRDWTRTFALLGSVSGLREPSPSLPQTIRSLLPGARFVVDWRERTVTSAATLELPAHVWSVAAGSARKPPVTLRGLDDQHAVVPGSAATWGARRWTEVTVVGTALPAVIEQMLNGVPADAVRCRSCGRVCGPSVCPFCQVKHVESANAEQSMDGAAA